MGTATNTRGKIVHTFCQHCHMGCPISAEVHNGKIVKIRGYTCEKGEYATEVVYHPDRLKYPLRRVGKRGGGKWQRVSWDEALDTMAAKFGEIKTKYGAESIATIHACSHKMMATVASVLFGRVLGTPQLLDVNYQCTFPGVLAEWFTIGTEVSHDIGPQYDQSQCIVIWGATPKHCRPTHERDINIARAKGAKLIVIDPLPPNEVVRDKPGLQPALWLRVRPGSDAALALGMINIVISEGLYDKEFVDKWCFGFEELKKRAQEYPVEKVSEITWIPKEKIIDAARLWATTKPSCLHIRLGTGSQQINATQTSRAIICLMSLFGNIDVKGGNLIADDLGGFIGARWMSGYDLGPTPPELEIKRFGFKEFPFIAGTKGMFEDFPWVVSYAINPPGFEAMLKGDLKAFYIPGSNVVLNEGNSRKTWAALNNLEFLVVADLFMTPTAELADLVLPAAHFLETGIPMRPWCRIGQAHQNYIMAPRKVVEPQGECWDDRLIVLELAKRMNVELPWKTVEDLSDWHLEKTNLTYNDVLNAPNQMVSFGIRYNKYEETGFNTPSGKIELYSNILNNHGHDPLPFFQEPPESPYSKPELWKEYPFILTQHRHRSYMHAEFREVPSLRKTMPDFEIEMSPSAAAKLSIKEGDRVYIERPGFKDRVYGKAKFVPEMHPNVITCASHWWFPEMPGPEHGCFISNINTITSSDPPYDPINGNSQIRAILCRIGKSTSKSTT